MKHFNSLAKTKKQQFDSNEPKWYIDFKKQKEEDEFWDEWGIELMQQEHERLHNPQYANQWFG